MIKTIAKLCFAFSILVTISACEKKSCSNVTCPVGEQCLSGSCICADGYEGSNCTTASANKYVGSYLQSEACSPTSPYGTGSPFITPDSYNPRLLHINNIFPGSCTEIQAYIHTDINNQGNTLEIPLQSGYCAGNQVSGRGTFDVANNRLVLQIDFVAGGYDYQCTETLYHQ